MWILRTADADHRSPPRLAASRTRSARIAQTRPRESCPRWNSCHHLHKLMLQSTSQPLTPNISSLVPEKLSATAIRGKGFASTVHCPGGGRKIALRFSTFTPRRPIKDSRGGAHTDKRGIGCAAEGRGVRKKEGLGVKTIDKMVQQLMARGKSISSIKWGSANSIVRGWRWRTTWFTPKKAYEKNLYDG